MDEMLGVWRKSKASVPTSVDETEVVQNKRLENLSWRMLHKTMDAGGHLSPKSCITPRNATKNLVTPNVPPPSRLASVSFDSPPRSRSLSHPLPTDFVSTPIPLSRSHSLEERSLPSIRLNDIKSLAPLKTGHTFDPLLPAFSPPRTGKSSGDKSSSISGGHNGDARNFNRPGGTIGEPCSNHSCNVYSSCSIKWVHKFYTLPIIHIYHVFLLYCIIMLDNREIVTVHGVLWSRHGRLSISFVCHCW